MILQTLASGSKGNSIFIRSGNTRVLIDAGVSCKKLTERLAQINERPEDIQAIFVTHEHVDHISGVRVFSKRFGTRILMNEACYASAENKYKLNEIENLALLETGSTFAEYDMEIRSLRVSHDTSDPVCYTVYDGFHRAGIFTDLGKVSTLIRTHGMMLDALVLEANHDYLMLKKNMKYPEYIKQRIRSNRGHLSNEQSIELALDLIRNGRLRHLTLAHLSDENNTPDLALQAYAEAFGRSGIDLPISAAPQHSIGKKIICENL